MLSISYPALDNVNVLLAGSAEPVRLMQADQYLLYVISRAFENLLSGRSVEIVIKQTVILE